jgi:glucan phosphorylase
MSLYLLDTDIDDNRWEDRSITHQLYGGDNEHRLKQELLLHLPKDRMKSGTGLIGLN